MKIRAAIIIAIVLGIFTYTLPLYADSSKEYHLMEKTVVEIPIVGKITSLSDSYLSGCKLKEKVTLKMHNSLIKIMSDSDGKSHSIKLSDMCEQVQWTFDSDADEYQSKSFDEIRKNAQHSDSHIDMDIDQNDIDEVPHVTREIMGFEKNINGFKAQKVVSTVYPEDTDNPIIIEEYYASDAKALKKIANARRDLSQDLGYDEGHIEGIPSMIEVLYESMREDYDWERPAGEVVRFIISMLDDDGDQLFKMTYDVTKSETRKFDPDHFALK